jgi:hypothetical protein
MTPPPSRNWSPADASLKTDSWPLATARHGPERSAVYLDFVILARLAAGLGRARGARLPRKGPRDETNGSSGGDRGLRCEERVARRVAAEAQFSVARNGAVGRDAVSRTLSAWRFSDLVDRRRTRSDEYRPRGTLLASSRGCRSSARVASEFLREASHDDDARAGKSRSRASTEDRLSRSRDTLHGKQTSAATYHNCHRQCRLQKNWACM